MAFDPDSFIGAPSGGTGVVIPPQQGMQVSSAEQALRDRARLAILEDETKLNPSDPALAREVTRERVKQGAAAPSAFDPDAFLKTIAPPAPKVVARTLKDDMGDQANEGWGKALETGIATSASKTARALGTTLLPKSMEEWAERKGLMPSARDIELLKAGTAASPAARTTEVVGDLLTDIAPAAKVMKGANTLRQALPRAAAVGTTIGGVRSEGETPIEILRDAAEGGAGGLIGEGVGRAVARGVTPYLRPSQEARRLMDRGIYPTMGDAADKATITGKILRAAEGQIESLPIFGIPQRAAKSKASQALFNEAAGMAVPPGATLPTGTKPEVLDQLGSLTGNRFGHVLGSTEVAVPTSMKGLVDKSLEQAAKGHNVSEAAVGKIKRELNEKLWSGVSANKMSGQSLWNITEDMFNGLDSVRGNTNAQKLVEEIAGQFKNHLNVVAGKQGHDLAGLRQSASNLHALNRTSGEDLVGSNLMTSVLANNRATGSVPTPQLQSLAEDASAAVTRARTPASLWRDAAAFHSGLAIPASVYGAANNSQGLKELLMREPKYRAAIMKALAAPSAVVGARSTIEGDK